MDNVRKRDLIVDTTAVMWIWFYSILQEILYTDEGYVRECDRRYTRMLSML